VTTSQELSDFGSLFASLPSCPLLVDFALSAQEHTLTTAEYQCILDMLLKLKSLLYLSLFFPHLLEMDARAFFPLLPRCPSLLEVVFNDRKY
jgi:hypothetical protein